jgi:Dolichyl-phosphate-mannose-protein mannosyltransferase
MLSAVRLPLRRPAVSVSAISIPALVPAVVLLAVLVATSTRYGYHRDELYFIQAGAHPAFGYPDQPPLVPLLCHWMNVLAPRSLLVLRLPSALAAAATSVVAVLVAREIGGDRRAQVLAGGCSAVASITVVTGHFVTTTTFDVLSTTVLCWLLVRAVVRGDRRALVWAGLVVGVGVEAKPQVLFVAVVLVAVLLLIGPAQPIRSVATVFGASLAAVLAAPYLIWQATHGWPQLTVASNIGGSAEGGRLGFVPFQLLLVSPVLVPVWVAGLVAPFKRAELRALRFLPVGYAVLAVAYLVGNGKAYYLASLYPTLLGIGALPLADWTRREGGRLRLGLVSAAIVLSAVASALVGLPVLPESALAGSPVLAVNPDQGETVGWPEFVDTIATAWRGLPTGDRDRAVIFTSNYGEAGAVDLLGGERGLPRAYSGHNAYSEWGPPADDRTVVLLVGFHVAYASNWFTGCRQAAVIHNDAGVDNDESGSPILVCSGTRAPWSTMWRDLKHYD